MIYLAKRFLILIGAALALVFLHCGREQAYTQVSTSRNRVLFQDNGIIRVTDQTKGGRVPL